jgi:signal transduction histidine kinase/CheY-like chemotaxis protein
MRPKQKSDLRAGHILYVGEDAAAFAEIQGCLLDMPQYVLLQEKTAVSAHLTLVEMPIDILLFEMPCPITDHLPALTALQQAWPDTPVLLLVEDTEAETARQIVAGTLYDYLSKSEINRSMLRRIIRSGQGQQRLRTELNLINRMARQLISTLDLAEVLATALEEVRRLLDVMACSIWLYDADNEELICRQVVGPGSEVILGWRLAKEQGIVGWVMAHGQPLLIHDTWTDTRHYTRIDEKTGLPIRSILCLPLQTKQKVLGALQIVDKEAGSFVETDLDLLQPLAAAAAIAIENARLYEQAQQEIAERKRAEDALRNRNRELGRLYRASNVLLVRSNSNLATLAQAITKTVQDEFDKANCSLFLVDPGSDSLRRVAVSGPYEVEVREVSLNLSGPGIVPEVIRSGKLLNVPDVLSQPRYQPGWSIAKSELAIPLRIDTKVIGAIDVQSEKLAAFTQEDERLLTYFASRAALALQTVRLFEETRRWATELEARVMERTEALHEANARLQQALQARDEFLANMSHELRTPLNAVLLRCELLLSMESPTPRQAYSVQIIQESSEHLLELINDVLDVAKIEAGKLELLIEPVAVQEVCQSSLRLMQNLAEAKQLKVIEKYDETAVVLQADRRRLKQILVNLLSNAIKFTQGGKRIGLEVQAGADDFIHFTVWDEGIGIAEADKERLFQPFVQLDGGLARQYEGSGLGLIMVERLVTLHRGRLHLESTPGQGSRFTVSLPIFAPVSLETITKHRAETAVSSPPLPPKKPLESGTILLAEDNQAVAEVLSEFLSLQGHDVRLARNGQEAVAAVYQKTPDLILMDIQMPGLDGLEAIRQIRTHLAGRHIPIIAITALVMAGDRERCLAAGADAYFSKPLGFAELSKILEDYMNTDLRQA